MEYHLGDIRSDVKDEIINTIELLKKKYPNTNLKKVILAGESEDVDAYYGGDGVITLYSNFLDPDNIVKKRKEMKGKHPVNCESIAALITHEFGHAIYETYRGLTNKAVLNYIKQASFLDKTTNLQIVSNLTNFWTNRSILPDESFCKYPFGKRSISQVRRECWAEAFCSLVHTPKRLQHSYVGYIKRFIDLVEDNSYDLSECIPWDKLSEEEKNLNQLELEKILKEIGIQ